jgi:hypothetical protein
MNAGAEAKAAMAVITVAMKAGAASAVITPVRSVAVMPARGAAWVAAKVAVWANVAKAAALAADAACSAPVI